jgi:UPF0755 protein
MTRLLRRLVLWGVIAGAFASGALVWWLQRPLALAGETAELSVEAGATPRQIAQGWVDAGVETMPWLLYEWFRWSGKARSIRAGNYEITAGTTPRALLDKLIAGDETLARVTFIEGWTFRQVREALAKAPSLKPDSGAMTDAAVMAALGAASQPAEGRFFPDTYTYARGTSDLAVLRRAHEAMARRLAQAWEARGPDSPLRSADEALTLASIVEKETGRPEDRSLVAGVFVNRLRKGMPLQTDPTVIYGLGTDFDGNLRKRDLLRDGPYNTYLRAGLPPTPISMPGRAALLAVVQPARSQALYFVARGDGTSHFSDSLAEHNRAVQQFQKRQEP